MDSLVRLMYRGVDIIDRDMNKLRFKCEYWRLLLSVPHTLWVRLRGWVSQEEARESRCLMDCFPAASPSPGADRARWCAGCESGRAAGKPGWSEPATEPSQATATPENEERCLQSRIEKHWTDTWWRITMQKAPKKFVKFLCFIILLLSNN